MSTDRRSQLSGEGQRDPLPQDDFAESLPVAEFEPQADGSKRALVYPADAPAHEIATTWLSAAESALVPLEKMR